MYRAPDRDVDAITQTSTQRDITQICSQMHKGCGSIETTSVGLKQLLYCFLRSVDGTKALNHRIYLCR